MNQDKYYFIQGLKNTDRGCVEVIYGKKSGRCYQRVADNISWHYGITGHAFINSLACEGTGYSRLVDAIKAARNIMNMKKYDMVNVVISSGGYPELLFNNDDLK